MRVLAIRMETVRMFLPVHVVWYLWNRFSWFENRHGCQSFVRPTHSLQTRSGWLHIVHKPYCAHHYHVRIYAKRGCHPQ